MSASKQENTGQQGSTGKQASAADKGNKVARTAERKRLRNRLVRQSVKTHLVKAKSSVDAGEESAYQKVVLAISKIDKAVSKGIIHKNKGARLKTRLMKRFNSNNKK